MNAVRDTGRWVVEVALVAAVLVLVLVAPASAHSELVRSDPPEGGLVAVGRTTLTLWFAEDADLPHSSFALHTSDGSTVPVTVGDDSAGSIVVLDVPPLERAIHVLDWRVTSLEDGHATGGSLLFGAGIRPTTTRSSGAGLPDADTVGIRWLDLTCLLLAIGAIAVTGRVLRERAPGRLAAARRQALVVGIGATLVALGAGAAAAVQRTPRDGLSWRAWGSAVAEGLGGTPWGHAWLVRETGLAVTALALLALARRAGGARLCWAIAAGAVVGVTVADTWVGHASTLTRGAAATALVDALHVVAAGVWAGSLGVLALCLLTRRRHPGGADQRAGASPWRAFSPMAAVATVVLVATGLYEAGRQLPDLGSVAATAYGRAITVKSVALVLALGLAGVNTLLVNPRLAATVGRRLGRSAAWLPVPRERFPIVVAAELAVLTVAVGAAALLTSVPTGREVAEASRVTAPRTAGVDGLFVTFEEVPAGPGRATVVVRANPTVRPQPGPIVGVDVLLVDPRDESTPVTLKAVDPGRYEAAVTAPGPGEWQAWVAVRRTSVPDAVATMTWVVRDPRRDPVTRLEVVTTTGAVLLTTGLVLVLVGVRRRRPARGGGTGARTRPTETAGQP
jgi:copper transport protein